MKWHEVGISCDGYITVERFKTKEEADLFVEDCSSDCYAEYIGEADTESELFFYNDQ